MLDYPEAVEKPNPTNTLHFRIGGNVGERIVTTDDQNIDADEIKDAKKIQQAKRILYQTP